MVPRIDSWAWFCLWCLIQLSTIFQVISWLSCLLVEEIGFHGENHWPVASHRQTLSHNVVSSIPRLNGKQTHNVSGDMHWLSLEFITTSLKWVRQYQPCILKYHFLKSCGDLYFKVHWYRNIFLDIFSFFGSSYDKKV